MNKRKQIEARKHLSSYNGCYPKSCVYLVEALDEIARLESKIKELESTASNCSICGKPFIDKQPHSNCGDWASPQTEYNESELKPYDNIGPGKDDYGRDKVQRENVIKWGGDMFKAHGVEPDDSKVVIDAKMETVVIIKTAHYVKLLERLNALEHKVQQLEWSEPARENRELEQVERREYE